MTFRFPSPGLGQILAASPAEPGEVSCYLESCSINFQHVAGRRGGLWESHCEKPAWNRVCPVRQADLGFSSPLGIVLWTIGVGTAIRLLCAATAIDLSYGEAYYVATARHFALSYFDHPPLSFWIVAATMQLTGSDALFVVRVPFILIFAATTWLMYRVGTSLFGEWAGALSALLLNISPLF